MLKGVNDSEADARELVRLIAGIPAKVNLIPFNPWPGSPFETSSTPRSTGSHTSSWMPALPRRSVRPAAGHPGRLRTIADGKLRWKTAVMRVKDVKKVVLAYSGGLDTSVILRWLQVTYRCEVVTFTADLGQGEELGPARQKAELFGVKEIFVDDLRETFVRDFVFPMFRANALSAGSICSAHRSRGR